MIKVLVVTTNAASGRTMAIVLDNLESRATKFDRSEAIVEALLLAGKIQIVDLDDEPVKAEPYDKPLPAPVPISLDTVSADDIPF